MTPPILSVARFNNAYPDQRQSHLQTNHQHAQITFQPLQRSLRSVRCQSETLRSSRRLAKATIFQMNFSRQKPLMLPSLLQVQNQSKKARPQYKLNLNVRRNWATTPASNAAPSNPKPRGILFSPPSKCPCAAITKKFGLQSCLEICTPSISSETTPAALIRL